MKPTILSLLLAAIIAGPAIAQDKEEKEVATAVEALRKAMIDPTQANLDALTCADLSYGHSSGVIQDKAAFMEALVSGKSDFVTIDLAQQTIKVVGNVALVRHILSATTNDGGKPGQTKLSILLVWLKQKGTWKLLARQAVKA
jgi:ketosteroid isomerase-like protein